VLAIGTNLRNLIDFAPGDSSKRQTFENDVQLPFNILTLVWVTNRGISSLITPDRGIEQHELNAQD
jgi:hypothetical protein